jgi:hypothetical protein
LFFSLLIAGSLSSALASTVLPSCATNTLANYITLTANPPSTGGCAIGDLDYYDFSYHQVSSAPAASAIQVTPLATGFSFGPVSAAPGVTVQFEIDYDLFIDPAPVITGDKLGIDPPTGNVVVTEYFCNDIDYVYTGSCAFSMQPESLTVGTPGTGYPSSASITFNPPANRTQEVGILFTLIGGANGASFDGLDSSSTLVYPGVSSVPEPPPAASLLLALALLTLALGWGRRFRPKPVIN